MQERFEQNKMSQFNERVSNGTWPKSDEIGQKPVLLYLPKDIIRLDVYQRDQAKQKKKIGRMLENFHWDYFRPLQVAHRDGQYYCVDGGGRLTAALRRDDITEVPCCIYESKDLAREAKTFVLIDAETTRIASVPRHNAMVHAKDPIALETEWLIKQSKRRRSDNNTMSPDTISCTGAIDDMGKEDISTLKKIWPLAISLMAGGPFYCKVLSALFYIEKHMIKGSITENKYSSKLRKKSGESLHAICLDGVTINRIKGKKGWAYGLVDYINKGQGGAKIRISEKVTR